jgi:hypothetical protein
MSSSTFEEIRYEREESRNLLALPPPPRRLPSARETVLTMDILFIPIWIYDDYDYNDDNIHGRAFARAVFLCCDLCDVLMSFMKKFGNNLLHKAHQKKKTATTFI